MLTFLKGGKGGDSILGITCEDSAYYVLLAAQFAWLFSFSGVFALKNIKRTQARKAVNYPFNEHDTLVSGDSCFSKCVSNLCSFDNMIPLLAVGLEECSNLLWFCMLCWSCSRANRDRWRIHSWASNATHGSSCFGIDRYHSNHDSVD